MFDNIVDFVDNRIIGEINNDFNNVKSSVKSIWSGMAANSFDLSLSDNISAIDKINASIDAFNNVLTNLALYKENKAKIEELERQIAAELANPSLKTTETYTENGVTRTRIVYVVDQALIARLRGQITALTADNERLRENITKSCNEIVSLNIKPKNNSDIAHRGYTPGGIHDNSLEGFRLAGEKGFWGCEADVRFDANGNLVCSHNTVRRGENPPSFADYLDVCKEYGMTAIIDLKYEKGVGPADSYLSPAILKVIEEKGMIDSCVIQTNNPTDIPYIRETSSSARIWYLTDVISDKNLEIIRNSGVECVNMQNGEHTSSGVRKLVDNGIDVCVWNVQTEQGKARYLKYGAKYIMSDNVLGITPYQTGEENFNDL